VYNSVAFSVLTPQLNDDVALGVDVRKWNE